MAMHEAAAWLCSSDGDDHSDDVNSDALLHATTDLDLNALPLELLIEESRELEESLARLQAGDSDSSVGISMTTNAVTGVADIEAMLGSDLAAASYIPQTSVSDATDATSGSSSAENEQPMPLKDSNSTRRRAKQELEFLRERVAELEAKLNELQQQARSSDDTSPVATNASSSPWEGVASRQRELRRAAEHQNTTLRASLETQLQLAKSLARLLRKRPSLWTDDAQPSKRTSSSSNSSESDADAFAALLARVDDGFATHLATLAATGLQHATCGFRATTGAPTTIVAADGRVVDSVCVELLDAKRMPFDLHATCRAAWRAITSGYMHVQHTVYEGFGAAQRDNVLALSYDVSMTRKRVRVDLHARAVMKRFDVVGRDGESSDSVVFVWTSLSDTAGTSQTPASTGVRVQETGWTVFTRHAATCGPDGACSSSDSDDATRVLTCMRMTPLVSSSLSSNIGSSSADTASEERQVGVLTSLSLEHFGVQLDDAQRAIESLALDDMRAQ